MVSLLLIPEGMEVVESPSLMVFKNVTVALENMV